MCLTCVVWERCERSVSPTWHRAMLIRLWMPADTPVQHGSSNVHALSKTLLPPCTSSLASFSAHSLLLTERRRSFINPWCGGSSSWSSTFFCHSAFLWLPKYSTLLSSSTSFCLSLSLCVLPFLSSATLLRGIYWVLKPVGSVPGCVRVLVLWSPHKDRRKNTHVQSEDILPFLTSLRGLVRSGLDFRLELGLGLRLGMQQEGLRLALVTQMP